MDKSKIFYSAMRKAWISPEVKNLSQNHLALITSSYVHEISELVDHFFDLKRKNNYASFYFFLRTDWQLQKAFPWVILEVLSTQFGTNRDDHSYFWKKLSSVGPLVQSCISMGKNIFCAIYRNLFIMPTRQLQK